MYGGTRILVSNDAIIWHETKARIIKKSFREK